MNYKTCELKKNDLLPQIELIEQILIHAFLNIKINEVCKIS